MKQRPVLDQCWASQEPPGLGERTLQQSGWTAWTSPDFTLAVGVCSEQIHSKGMLTDTYATFSVCTTTDLKHARVHAFLLKHY